MRSFSTDWVSQHADSWHQFLMELRGRPNIRGLEIGSWEGRSACWWLDNILTGKGATLDCVDSWEGFAAEERRFEQNTAEYGERIRKHKSDSFAWLLRHQSPPLRYDFIYVDGCHEAEHVLNDLALAWPLLRPGAFMICDDYVYEAPDMRTPPRTAIDGFFACRDDWTLLQAARQFVVRKKSHNGAPQTASARPAAVATRRSRGVVTGASQHYWITLRLQVEACRQAGVDVAISDHGLTPRQRSWLAHQGAMVLDAPAPPTSQLLQQTEISHWNLDNQWHKAAVCQDTPFDDTIWIDADAVPIRGLEGMFGLLESGPWLTLESYITELHARQVYLGFVHLLRGRIPPRYRHASRINSGIFGFRKGDAWIGEWADLCARIVCDEHALRACKLRDQHALVALMCMDLDLQLPRIVEDRGLNWPANGCQIDRAHNRKNYPWDEAECLSMLREDHPDASVVHWLGGPKPWMMETSTGD